MRNTLAPWYRMCDLLDAADCFAGVLLLALVAIRAKDGEINPKAKEYNSAKSAILDRSFTHKFSHADCEGIGRALCDLKGIGNP